jgi:hypothetical protein
MGCDDEDGSADAGGSDSYHLSLACPRDGDDGGGANNVAQ